MLSFTHGCLRKRIRRPLLELALARKKPPQKTKKTVPAKQRTLEQTLVLMLAPDSHRAKKIIKSIVTFITKDRCPLLRRNPRLVFSQLGAEVQDPIPAFLQRHDHNITASQLDTDTNCSRFDSVGYDSIRIEWN